MSEDYISKNGIRTNLDSLNFTEEEHERYRKLIEIEERMLNPSQEFLMRRLPPYSDPVPSKQLITFGDKEYERQSSAV
ncbi:MAG: hypothetical protein KJ905_04050 [Nanoarchaeota archaeon]|nr:hypothetical protein [Nanoarchaeota archaeon]MBU2459279.1 hypothetical protein [Nanoarchaeota archaeon]